MCGRKFSTFTEEELAMRYLSDKRSWRWPVLPEIPQFEPNYNTCPSQSSLVLSVEEEQLAIRPMRWGLVPPWAKTVKEAAKYSLINARSEEIAEKRSYQDAYQKRRCIIPVSGFYEWKRSGKTKRPFAIRLKQEPIMSLAGVWEHWIDKKTGEVVDSFALITTKANTFMEKIHDRMPVILPKEAEEKWLDPKVTDPQKLTDLLVPCPSEWLEAVEISTLVNSPRNNSPDVLQPISQEKE